MKTTRRSILEPFTGWNVLTVCAALTVFTNAQAHGQSTGSRDGLLKIPFHQTSSVGDTGIRYPFPQNRTYRYGIMPAARNHVDAQESYLTWKNNYVTTSGACGYRRVLFNDMSSTYSEGIGYGMLLAANYGDRELFDDLWRYYAAHLDPRGLMDWWIGSTCGQRLGSSAATDADEDVAFALLLADKQWGSAGTINYLQRAITQINRIYQHEVERNTYVLKPGDIWGGSNVTNPSYFAPAYYRAFRAVTGNAGWDSVIAKCYTILDRSANVNTGLVPDWCQASGAPAPGYAYYYYYDATRTPWRIALDYVWFGEPRARAFCEKISNFARGIGSVNIREGYYLDGTPMGWGHINVFVGPFAAGSMGTNLNYQAFCDSAYLDNVTTVPPGVNGNYYNMSLRTLTLFLQTGNFFNPLDTTFHILPPGVPALASPLNGTVGNTPSLRFAWHSSPTAASYRLQIASDSSFTSLVLNDSTIVDTSRQVTGLQPLTWYYWRVSAKNVGGTSPFSQHWSFKVMGVPTSVALLSPVNNALNLPTSVTFIWRRANDQTSPLGKLSSRSDVSHVLVRSEDTEDQLPVSKYWFEISTDTNALAVARDTTITDTTITVSSLANQTTYFWRVRAKNEVGWGAFGPWWRFTTIIAVPAAPLLVSPTTGSVGHGLSLAVIWRHSQTAERYRLQIATDTSFSGLVVNDSTLTDTTRALSGLMPLTTYYWRVNAKNIAGISPYSVRWSFRTAGVPTRPFLLIPDNNSINQPTSLTFSWHRAIDQTSPLAKQFGGPINEQLSLHGNSSSVNGKTNSVLGEPEVVSKYWFELVTDTVAMSDLVRDSTLTDTLKSVTGLGNATTYFWRVKARNIIGWGEFSAWWQFTTIVTAPIVPVLSFPPNHSVNQPTTLTLRWYHTPGAVSYRLQMASDPTFTSGLVMDDSTLADTARAVSGLTVNTLHYWRVNSRNAGGSSQWSQVWDFTTLPQQPGQITLVAPTNNALIGADSVLLVWRRGTPAVDRYWLETANDSLFAISVVDSSITDTNRIIQQLNNRTNYWWRVRAGNAAGWGPFGEVRRFMVLITAAGLSNGTPREFQLEQNYPNPFNPVTSIRYSLPQKAFVILVVYNPLGQEVARLVEGEQSAGHYEARWHVASVASGLYLYRFEAHGDAGQAFIQTRKMLLLK